MAEFDSLPDPAILTILANCESADFTFLEAATRLTKDDLSAQLTRLDEAGLVDIERTIAKNRAVVTVRLTREGRRQSGRY